MNGKLIIVLIVLGAGLFWVRGQRTKHADDGAAGATVTWMTDAPAAFSRAQSENKTVLMNFTGSDWCGWCIRLDKEVFSTSAFESYAEKNLVLLKIDFPRNVPQSQSEKLQNQGLQSKYRVSGFPTIVVADPGGTEKGRLGYQPGGPKAWLASLEKVR